MAPRLCELDEKVRDLRISLAQPQLRFLPLKSQFDENTFSKEQSLAERPGITQLRGALRGASNLGNQIGSL